MFESSEITVARSLIRHDMVSLYQLQRWRVGWGGVGGLLAFRNCYHVHVMGDLNSVNERL